MYRSSFSNIRARPARSWCRFRASARSRPVRWWPPLVMRATSTMAESSLHSWALCRASTPEAASPRCWVSANVGRLSVQVTDPQGSGSDPSRPKQGRSGQRLACQSAGAAQQERGCRCAGQQECPDRSNPACQGPPILIDLPSQMRLGGMNTSPGTAM